MTHRDNDHAIGPCLALTGHPHPRKDVLGIEPPASPQDMSSMGSVVSRVRPGRRAMFSYVTLGELRHLGHHDSMGQNAGCLGRGYDPFVVSFERPGPGTLDLGRVTSVLAGVDARQLGERRRLLGHLTPIARLEPTAGLREPDGHMQKAFDLLGSPAGREAFDLGKEPARVRERYGPSPFARNCLRAWRLVAAGVPLVTVYSFGDRVGLQGSHLIIQAAVAGTGAERRQNAHAHLVCFQVPHRAGPASRRPCPAASWVEGSGQGVAGRKIVAISPSTR